MGPSAQPVRHRSVSGLGAGAAVKHRACDECRTRKLACTKEPGGCARCKREGIDCHYSAQKPMGRPRKRPAVAVVVDPSSAPQEEVDLDSSIPHVRVPGTDTPGGGPDINMADATNMLDFLGPDCAASAEPVDANPGHQLHLTQPWRQGIWKFDIDFDAHHLPPPPAATTYPYSPHPFLATDPPSLLSSQRTSPPDVDYPLVDPALSSLPTTTTTTTTTTVTDPPLQPVSCACLASLYLALDSTARLPTEVMPAIHVARSACRTAQETILCQTCCPPPLAPTQHSSSSSHPPPSLPFQNMMLLCALVPAIADAYHRILALVDAETARALAARARMPFSLSRCGGLGSRTCDHHLLAGSTTATAAAVAYEDRLLEPAQWRLTVRGLLRLDVYGIDCNSNTDGEAVAVTSPPPPAARLGSGTGAGGFSQGGLRALVAQMEERSRTRHEEIDAMIDAGLVVPRTAGGLQLRHTKSLQEEGKMPPCRHIIGLAREAVESLVIA